MIMEAPRARHWSVVKQILHYIAGTVNYGCSYRRSEISEPALVGFSDSDLAGDVDDRKTTGGSVFFYGGSLVTRASQKQRVFVPSSCEAEYIASANAAFRAFGLVDYSVKCLEGRCLR